jgi:intracellular sulfur oxidation DsrE/DsrF family protein
MLEQVANVSRRNSLRSIGMGALALYTLSSARTAAAAEPPLPQAGLPHGAKSLRDLADRLEGTPRRRSFDRVPFVLTEPDAWDQQAANELLAYSYDTRQMWDVADLEGPWPVLMREAMNGQVFAHHHPDFLAVAATHGSAHLVLFTQSAWDRYDLAKLAGPKFVRNTLIVEKDGVAPTDDLQNLGGFYGPLNNNIVSLQRRGAVFIACHDSIHAIARKLHDMPAYARSSSDEIAADLTNNLIPGVVLVPSVVAFMVELQKRGFTYV